MILHRWLTALGILAAGLSMVDSAAAAPRSDRPTVLLVHGAWADGSGWSEVIARLQADGLRVVAVQNQLNSLADDVAEVTRALERETGRVVLVAHSWGGTVITQAGDASNVAALVYVAAFAPDQGESTNDLQRMVPLPGYVPLLSADSAGYLWFPQEALPEWFAQDLPPRQAATLASAQNPIRASAFDERVSTAAWHDKPSWYLLTEEDRMISPALQQTMATRMRARVETVRSSHVPFLSRPQSVVKIIEAAVDAVGR